MRICPRNIHSTKFTRQELKFVNFDGGQNPSQSGGFEWFNGTGYITINICTFQGTLMDAKFFKVGAGCSKLYDVYAKSLAHDPMFVIAIVDNGVHSAQNMIASCVCADATIDSTDVKLYDWLLSTSSGKEYIRKCCSETFKKCVCRKLDIDSVTLILEKL